MKICFPIAENKDLASPIGHHFNSSPKYLLVDAERRSVDQVLENNIGVCNSFMFLADHNVGAVVVNGIEADALSELHRAGCKVYQAA